MYKADEGIWNDGAKAEILDELVPPSQHRDMFGT